MKRNSNTEQFLKHSQKYLHTQIEQEVIKEAEEIEKKDAENEKFRLTFTPQQLQKALSETPSEMIRRALSETPSEIIRRALAESPAEQLRRALAETPNDLARRALAGIETSQPLLRKDWDEYIRSARPLSELFGTQSGEDPEDS